MNDFQLENRNNIYKNKSNVVYFSLFLYLSKFQKKKKNNKSAY